MASPVSLEEAKLHLRVDGTEDDTRIPIFIDAATEQAQAFCKRTWSGTDANGAEIVAPASVKAAILLMVGDLMENPAADINQAAKMLLWPYRLQVFA